MLLTLTTTHRPATDLGYLLAKNPSRSHTFALPFGQAHVVWPEATEDRATAALLVELDAIGLVRGGHPDQDAPLAQYVNDRPYAASSFLSVALARVFHTALNGRSRERQELADTPIPLACTIHALPCHGGEALVRRLFEPLGYTVSCARAAPREGSVGAAGSEPVGVFDVHLAGTARLADLLGHVYVLVPVLDDGKHYWVGQDEVDKLVARAEAWLPDHPERELVVRRYLKHRRPLVRDALERLDPDAVDAPDDPTPAHEDALEAPLSLNGHRMATVLDVLRRAGARSVADLGCGEGRLLVQLARDDAFERVVGVDVSIRSLERAKQKLDRLHERHQARVTLRQGSVTYRDAALQNLDAAVLIEVIEHVDAERLPALERAVFADAAPRLVVVTTPNVEYNVRFATPGFRHRDHRFEWTRAEFAAWASAVADRHGYTVRIEPIGPVDPDLGAPTQMGVFTR